MVDAVTNNYSLTLPLVGGDIGTWGTVLNGGTFTPTDAVLGNTLPLTITVADQTLTTTQFQNAVFTVTGGLTGNRNLILPLSSNSATSAVGGKFIVVNNSTGSFNLTCKTAASGSAGVIVPRLAAVALYSDGTNVGYDNTGLPATIPAVSGNPTGQLAGTAGSVNTNASIAADYTNGVIYLCTTSGTASSAIYTPPALAAGQVTQTNLAQGAAPLPAVFPQTADNLQLANDGTNPTLTVSVTKGRVRDDSDVTNLQLIQTIYKRLDTGWAAGGSATPGNGGCDTGTKGASQTWHAFLIGKLSMTVTQYARAVNVVTLTSNSHGLGIGTTVRVVGVAPGVDGLYPITAVTTNTFSYGNNGSPVSTTAAPTGAIADGMDVLYSQSYSAPSLPSGWTVKQCLGSILTDGSSNVQAFTQVGDQFLWTTPTLELTNESWTSAARVLKTIRVPLGVKVHAIFKWLMGVANVDISWSSPDQTDQVVSGSAGPLLDGRTNINTNWVAHTTVRTNTSAQIGVRTSADSGSGGYLSTLGYHDPRRRMF